MRDGPIEGEPADAEEGGSGEQLARGRGSAPTIRDVAKLAGVSHMTVSRVINRERLVRQDTLRRVEAAIRTLNYKPNPVARALSGGEHVRVALLHRYPNPGSLGDFLAHLLDELARTHASLVARKVPADSVGQDVVADLVGDGVRAAILAPPLADDEKLVSLLLSNGIVLVATGATRAGRMLPTVGIDDRGAARAMTEHLLSLGHRRIGFIAGDPSHASTELRQTGFREALGEAASSIDERLIVRGFYTYQSGLDAAEALLALPERPTAIFASNDDMAAAAVAVAHKHGIDVPAELTVCGFDDTYLATTIWPALTTIRQPMAEVTRTAMELVRDELARMRAGLSPGRERVVLDYLLVRRQSDAIPGFLPAARG